MKIHVVSELTTLILHSTVSVQFNSHVMHSSKQQVPRSRSHQHPIFEPAGLCIAIPTLSPKAPVIRHVKEVYSNLIIQGGVQDVRRTVPAAIRPLRKLLCFNSSYDLVNWRYEFHLLLLYIHYPRPPSSIF